MPEAPIYLVDAESDPVFIRVQGRASFANSACLQDFCSEMIKSGRPRFVFDFQACTSMDSTFLGALAGIALDLRRLSPPGSLVVSRLNPRNLELVQNLGLNRLLKIDQTSATPPGSAGATTVLACKLQPEIESARHVLAAHENLVVVDEANRTRFQDVLAFVRQRVEQGE